MATTLPQPVRLSLEQALAQWRRWRPSPATAPEALQLLAGGRSNTSVLVGNADARWVVRIDGTAPDRLGLSRSAEWQSLEHAAGHAIAPRPVYRNSELGVLVVQYQETDESAVHGIAELAELLRAIHALPSIHFRLDPLARARRYLALAGGGELPAELLSACHRLAAEPVALHLCHNDLLVANRLASGGRLLAIDWEYVAMGDPLFDLAVIIEGDGLADAEALELHSRWLGRQPGQTELDRLSDQRVVYRALASLWEAIPRSP